MKKEKPMVGLLFCFIFLHCDIIMMLIFAENLIAIKICKN